MERCEDKFLLELVEQDHLDGSYIFAVGWNGHILVISALDGDRFISWLKMGLQFGLPHAEEMKGRCIEWLEGLVSQLEVMQQSNQFIE